MRRDYGPLKLLARERAFALEPRTRACGASNLYAVTLRFASLRIECVLVLEVGARAAGFAEPRTRLLFFGPKVTLPASLRYSDGSRELCQATHRYFSPAVRNASTRLVRRGPSAAAAISRVKLKHLNQINTSPRRQPQRHRCTHRGIRPRPFHVNLGFARLPKRPR